jgi:hypothetical protein
MTRQRKIEVVVTAILLILFAALLVWAVVAGKVLTWADALTRFAFAIVIALGVRWLGILFESLPSAEDIYKSSGDVLRTRIDEAQDRVWVMQTWLPQIDGDAGRILRAKAPDKRVILGSYRFNKDTPELSSAMYARIRTRAIDLRTAMANSASSFMPFYQARKSHIVRFNPVHHPGWVAVIDTDVFWGQTPLDADNWNVPEVCHRANTNERRAKYWIEQFMFLWEGEDRVSKRPWCHDLTEELEYNVVLHDRIRAVHQAEVADAAAPRR